MEGFMADCWKSINFEWDYSPVWWRTKLKICTVHSINYITI